MLISRGIYKAVAIGLVTCCLSVSAILFRHVAEHQLHHAHHGATTHSTPLCAWVCASGEVHQGFSPPVTDDPSLVEVADFPLPSRTPVLLTSDSPARAPPTSLT